MKNFSFFCYLKFCFLCPGFQLDEKVYTSMKTVFTGLETVLTLLKNFQLRQGGYSRDSISLVLVSIGKKAVAYNM